MCYFRSPLYDEICDWINCRGPPSGRMFPVAEGVDPKRQKYWCCRRKFKYQSDSRMCVEGLAVLLGRIVILRVTRLETSDYINRRSS